MKTIPEVCERNVMGTDGMSGFFSMQIRTGRTIKTKKPRERKPGVFLF